MQLEYLATISLPDEGWDVSTLEEQCWEAARRVGKELFIQALEQRGEKVMAKAAGDKKGEVRRYLTTRLGAITFCREKVRQERGGGYSYVCPLDKAIGLQPRQEATLWVKKRACELATKYTYREAAALLSTQIGDEVSHGAIHRWVQEKGKALRQEEDRRWQAVFEDGEVFEGEGEEKEIVVTEMDATMLYSQERGRKKLAVKLGVMYSGKELESETAKYKRYRLTDKTLYGGIEEPEEFGEKLYLKGEEKLSLSKARNLLVLGDGDPWIKNIAEGPYFMATYQLDWRHLMVKIHQTFSDQPKLVSELIDYLYSGQDERMLTTVKPARLLCENKDKRQKIADLVTYIENNRDGLYGSRSLRDKVETKRVLVCSTGAMEKNIDVVIGRRFKKHGMSWSAKGANNLLKLRTLLYNKIDWEASWRKQSSCGVSLPPTN
jgi:hypothetical protein